jgi:hypothetical protein
MGHILSKYLSPETKKAHRATWYVWSGGEKMRAASTMRGTWGWDATCSCGRWQSHTGGATRGSVEDALYDHRRDAEFAAEILEADTASRIAELDGHTHLINADGEKICTDGGPKFLASRERDGLSCVGCNLLLRWARNETGQAVAR